MVGGRCPGCGANSVVSNIAVHRQIRPHFFVLTMGLFGTFFVIHAYPLLDTLNVVRLALGVYFFAFLTIIVLGFARRLANNMDLVKGVYLFCGTSLILLCGFVWGNGALDKAPTTPIQTTILRKDVTHGSHNSTSYKVTVASWRPGKLEETLDVKGNLFRKLPLNQPVVVEVHPGRFGMPWYSAISPAPPET
jgi:hypothetical protein